MLDLFSDIFIHRENGLKRLDPRMKLFVVICALITLILSRGFVYPLVILGAALLALLLVRIPIRFIAVRLFMPAGIVLVLVALKLFLTQGEPLFRPALWGVTLTITREGLASGISMGARVAAAVTLLILFGSVTPAHSIFHAMRWMHAPREWVELALLMYRYIFVLVETTANMATAQRLRLSYNGTRNSLRSAGVLCGAVVLKSVDQAVKAGEAMALRGHTGSAPLAPLKAFPRGQGIASATACLSVIVVYGVCEWFLR
jgi:cobalt/nickel transport system permease protein